MIRIIVLCEFSHVFGQLGDLVVAQVEVSQGPKSEDLLGQLDDPVVRQDEFREAGDRRSPVKSRNDFLRLLRSHD